MVLDVECDMDNREKQRSLDPHRKPAVSDFHAVSLFFFFSDDIRASFQMQILNKKIIDMETQCIHIQQNIAVKESVQEIVLKTDFLMTF